MLKLNYPDKHRCHIHPHQQHRLIVGISVIKTVTAAIHPAIILQRNMVAAVAVDFEGVGGIREVEERIGG